MIYELLNLLLCSLLCFVVINNINNNLYTARSPLPIAACEDLVVLPYSSSSSTYCEDPLSSQATAADLSTRLPWIPAAANDRESQEEEAKERCWCCQFDGAGEGEEEEKSPMIKAIKTRYFSKRANSSTTTNHGELEGKKGKQRFLKSKATKRRRRKKEQQLASQPWRFDNRTQGKHLIYYPLQRLESGPLGLWQVESVEGGIF